MVAVETHVEIPDDFDPFAMLFSEGETDGVKVELCRQAPDIWKGVPIKGYIDDLSPGHDYQYIKTTYGGGRYRLIKRDLVTGRILDWRQVDVSGPPKITVPKDESVGVVPGSTPTVRVAGLDIPVTGDTDKIKDLLLFVKAIRTAFPEPPDYNQVILQALLNREPDDFLARLASFRQAFPDAFSSSGNNIDSWPAVVSRIADAANTFFSQRGFPAAVPAGRRQLPGQRPALPFGSIPDKPPEVKEETEKQMEPKTLAAAAVSQIVSSFRLGHSVSQVIGSLDMVLPLKPEERASLAVWKEPLFVYAETELADDFSDDTTEKKREDFREYFNRIFETFTDPNRGTR